MTKINMNNVIVLHKDHEISIAQHKVGHKTEVQEIMIFGPYVDDEVIPFVQHHGPLGLVEALQTAISLIDEKVDAL
jgi:hypothetical protein